MSVFDTFPRASFNGIEFPVESSRIDGGLRDHIHEYPHSPGGSPEKLGRSLYEFKVEANFDARFLAYPGLYPQNLDTLIGFFEQQATADFRLPQMPNAVPSYCRKWSREMRNKIRSGERVELLFIEDQSTLFLFQDLVSSSTANTASAALNFNAQISLLSFTPPTSIFAIFDGINAFVGQIQALQDTAELYGTRLSDAVQGLINTCESLDSQDSMQLVPAYALVESLHALWASAQTLANDIQQNGVQLQSWVVPAQMDIGRVSMSLYSGDSSRASDLLALNDIPDPLLIPAGMSLYYYPQAA
jgi:prophage DNA circulation protein